MTVTRSVGSGWVELPGAREKIKQAFGMGVLAVGLYIETEAKREAPVRGGYRSFMTTRTGKAGQVLIGGTLRRSIHTAAFQDGKPIHGASDENGVRVPDYPRSGSGVEVYVGTNSGYGRYVEEGTYKMAARPFLSPALELGLNKAEGIMAATGRRLLGAG